MESKTPKEQQSIKIIDDSKNKSELALGASIDDSSQQNVMSQKVITPASLLVKRAGADKPAKKAEQFARNEFRIQMEDVEQSGQELAEKIISFDVQNYINQRIEEKTAPIIKKSVQFMTNVNDLTQRFGDFKYDYQEFKGNTIQKLTQTVTQQDHREAMGNLDKKIYTDISQIHEDIIESKGRLDEADHAFELNERHIKTIELSFQGLKAQLNTTIKYMNDTADRVEGIARELQNRMDSTLDNFEKLIKDIETRQEEDRVSTQINADKVLDMARDMMKQSIDTDAKIGSLKQHYVRKLTSVKMQGQIDLLRTAEKLTSEFQHLNKRLRHKLLYQIGLTNDPWQDKRDFVVDEEYSQNLEDPMDVLKVRRSASFDKFTGFGRRHDVNRASLIEIKPTKKGKTPKRKPGTAKEESDARPYYNTQKKYGTKYDKNNTGVQEESDGFWQPITTVKDEYDDRAPNKKQKPQALQAPEHVNKLVSKGQGSRESSADGNRVYISKAGKSGNGQGTRTPQEHDMHGVWQGGPDPRTIWREDQEAFLRAKRRLTFRAQAMRILDHSRKDFMFELDADDRYIRERKGRAQLDWQKINPHRVQMFSINEVWRCVQQRLVELNVMKHPDDAPEVSDQDSSELDEEFDFVTAAKGRAGLLFTGKRKKDSTEKSLAELMKQKDLILINEVLQRCAEHEGKLLANREALDEIENEQDNVRVFRLQMDDFTEKYKVEQKDVTEKIKKANKRHKEFTENYFPKFMNDWQEVAVKEVIRRVHKIQSEVVTTEGLTAALAKERDGPVQERIDKMTEVLKGLLNAQEAKLTGTVNEALETQRAQIAETNQTIDVVNQSVQKHEAAFRREDTQRDPLSEEEMAAQGITKRYGLLCDRNGKPLPLTKMEVMTALAESNRMRYLLEDQVLSVAESISMQEDQIKSLNKKLSREKSDAQVLVEKNRDDLGRDLDLFRVDIQEVLTQVSMNPEAQDRAAGEESAFNLGRGSKLGSTQLGGKGAIKPRLQKKGVRASVGANNQTNQVSAIDKGVGAGRIPLPETSPDEPIGNPNDFSVTTNSFPAHQTITQNRENDYSEGRGGQPYYKPQQAGSVSLTVKRGTDGSVGSRRKSVISKLSVQAEEPSGPNTGITQRGESKDIYSRDRPGKLLLPQVNGGMRQTQQLAGGFKRGLGRSSLVDFGVDSPNKMLKAQHNLSNRSKYGSQDLQVQSQATRADKAFKDEGLQFLTIDGGQGGVKGGKTRPLHPGGKLVAATGKDFIRAHARQGSDIYHTERKKPAHQAKYSSALAVYTAAKRNKNAHGTIDVNRMDKMPHYELSPKHLAGGHINLLSERSPPGSVERMTDFLIQAESSKDRLKQSGIFKQSSKDFSPDANKLVGSMRLRKKQDAGQLGKFSKSMALKPGSLRQAAQVQVQVKRDEGSFKVEPHGSTMTIGDDESPLAASMPSTKRNTNIRDLMVDGGTAPSFLGSQQQYMDNKMNQARLDQDARQAKKERRLKNLVGSLGANVPSQHRLNVAQMPKNIQIKTNLGGSDPPSGHVTDHVVTAKHAVDTEQDAHNQGQFSGQLREDPAQALHNMPASPGGHPQTTDMDQDGADRPQSSDQMTAVGMQPSLSPFRTTGTKDNVFSTRNRSKV